MGQKTRNATKISKHQISSRRCGKNQANKFGEILCFSAFVAKNDFLSVVLKLKVNL